MSDFSQGEGWWVASDGKWYAPELHPDYVAPVAPPPAEAPVAAQPEPQAAQPPAAQPVAGSVYENPASFDAAPPAFEDSASPPTMTAAGEPAYVLPETAEQTETASRRGLLLGMGGLILIAGLGFLLFRLFSGGGGTGAASPEAAVDQLITSIAEGDAVGIAEVFDPDEIDGWVGSFVPASEKIAELSDTENLASTEQYNEAFEDLLSAFDIEITGPRGEDITYDVRELDAEGRIVRVRIEGLDITLNADETIDTALILGSGGDVIAIDTSRVDGAGAELRDQGDGIAARGFAPGQETVDDFARNVHMDLVAVEKDGEWYLSVGYTILENIRNVPDADLGRPDFGRAFELVDSQEGGAESAEDAVRQFLTSAETLDYDEMIRLTDPLSLPYLHDYQPGIDAQIDPRDVNDAADEFGLRFETIELGTSEWEDRTLVTVNELSGRVDGGSFEVNTDTWCALARSNDGDRAEGCLEDAMKELLFELDNFETDPRDLVPESAGIVVRERNGRFYVDPLGTMGFYLDQVAVAVIELQDDIIESNGLEGGVGEALVVATGPVVGLGDSITIEPIEGQAAAALDIRDANSSDVPGVHLAIIEIDSDGQAELVDGEGDVLNGNQRLLAFLQDDDDPIFPGLVALTDAAITVEILPAEVIEVDSDGWSGSIDSDGTPVVAVFNGSDDFEFTGTATFDTFWDWEDAGVVGSTELRSGAGSDPSRGDFTVFVGDPGDSIDITSITFDIPEPPDEPGGDFTELVDAQANSLSAYLSTFNYDYQFDQIGGYFDGCGPDDPDVTTYAFEDFDGHRLLVTPYPSSGRALDAFDALLAMSSPCDAYPGLVIDEIISFGDNSIQITLSDEDNPEPYFEYYAVRDNLIVVSTGNTTSQLFAGVDILTSWPG